jgi:uncharacterized protein YfcZ (UPF0381/DUF406 family)
MLTKKQFKTAVMILLMLYAVIFVVRSVYDLITYDDPTIGENFYYSSLKEDLRMSSNVASLRKEYTGESGGVEVLDQKYERIASISTKTISYDTDLTELNQTIEQYQAVVQMENAQGLSGNRKLYWVIGVKPQYFDSCLADMQKIGMLISSTSQKIDKTYEYRQMLAQKEELEKRLESYTSLRDHGGSMQEMLNLEDKIIEVESQLLRQSVDLGEYSDDNALCTINVSLYEGNPISVARKIWNAFTWTNKCYFSIIGALLFLCLAAFMLTKAYFYLHRILTSSNEKNPEKNEK